MVVVFRKNGRFRCSSLALDSNASDFFFLFLGQSLRLRIVGLGEICHI